jgi:ADP-ribose pyrophosphatase YjhB (NUDIX family)
MKFLIRYIYQASRFLWLLLKTTSVGVRLLMIRDDQVLLVKHVYEPYWYIPGGAVEHNESLEDAVRREALEEAGATLHDLQLFGAYTNQERGKCDHVIVYLTRDFDLSCQGDDEIEFCRFFPLDDLPEDMSQGTENRIKEFLAGRTNNYGDW